MGGSRDPPDRDPLNKMSPWTDPPSQTETPRQRPPCGQTNTSENITFSQFHLRVVNIKAISLVSGSNDRVVMAQGKHGIWFLHFPDRENTGNLVLTQEKKLLTQGKYLDCDY